MDRVAELPPPGRVLAQLRGFAAAVSFLTRIPSHRLVPHEAADLATAPIYFPVVGAIVGLAGALAFGIAALLWTPVLAAILAVAFTVWVTGAFHEDALADSLDGFGGGWSSAQVLTIMKDSRIGSYALVGVALVLAARVAAIVALFDRAALHMSLRSSIVVVAQALVVAHVLGRWSSVLLMRTTSYVGATRPCARPSAGGPFSERLSIDTTLVASGLAFVVTGIVLRQGVLALLAVTIAVTWCARRYFLRRIGGITGDALGAANQFVELAIYLALAAHLRS